MRFDLAVNGMTWGAWSTGVLPLMRDGTQWRPLMHVRDAASAIRFVLGQPPGRVSGRVLNAGPRDGNVRLADLAARVAAALPRPARTEWYGDPDARSYRVAFDRLAGLGWQARHGIEAAVAEIAALLAAGRLERSPRTITLDCYDALERRYGALSDPEAAFAHDRRSGPGARRRRRDGRRARDRRRRGRPDPCPTPPGARPAATAADPARPPAPGRPGRRRARSPPARRAAGGRRSAGPCRPVRPSARPVAA